jgi:hypothetical protein
MPCPTCDCTMTGLPSPEGYRQWWCPRCGTIKNIDQGGFESIARTSLASDCRRIIRDRVEANDQEFLKLAHREGMLECALLPDQRPVVA